METSERNLWATVLLVAISDAKDSAGCGIRECRIAQDWIGTYPSPDFRLVCQLAGLEPDAVHERLLPMALKARADLEKQFAWIKPRRSYP